MCAGRAVWQPEERCARLDLGRGGRRLRAGGPNAIDEEAAGGIARLALAQLKSPLVLILVFGGLVSALLRDWLEAAIILAVVLGSSGLAFLQEYRASNAVARLRQRLALTAARLARR
ncbi:MAG: cation-transporting P-type ATPase [Burkholderiaceae bacterium]|nr:cation-transporting P-type ATPase [Burkholderiaceae bacterium]